MAKKSSDYFGWGYLVSLILAILPTAWILGILTRFKEGAIVAGIIRIFLGEFIWILDLVFMITSKHIFRYKNII